MTRIAARWLPWAVGLLIFVGPPSTFAQRRPNFVFILGEGQGWTSTSVPMDDTLPASRGDLVRTPNLEKIAAHGMRFAQAYAPSPRCTASRASLLTGKSPAQLHMTFIPESKGESGGGNPKVLAPHAMDELPKPETTIAELLKKAGYATAQFGKWHVGHLSPKEHGFDETDGANGNRGPENVANPNPKQAFAIAERGIDFMARQAKAGRPFYLQVCQYAGKGPEDVRPETYADVARRAVGKQEKQIGSAAVMQDMDTTVGMLLAKLSELGIADNTYVIYTADHGTPGPNNRPLRDGKGTVWDGGLRVPLLIAGPGVKAGACSHVRVTGMDLFATFAELAGTRALPHGVEGGSLVLLLATGKGTVQRQREEFVVHFPHYDKDEQGPASTILLGNYKLIRVYETGQRRLFDLSKDIGERNDLAQQLPEKCAELDRRLSEYLQAVDAQMPAVNPNPSQASETAQTKMPRQGKRQGQGSGKRGGRGGDRPGSAEQGNKAHGKKKQENDGQGNTGPAPQGEFCTDVPKHPFDIVFGRPTPSSVTASVLFYENAEGCVFWGTRSGVYSSRTPTQRFTQGTPVEVVLEELLPNTAYYYQLRYRASTSSPVQNATEGRFHTPRSPGNPFVFTIQADPHLDEHTEPALYRRTLENALADRPDFHIDLGDTFMTEKHASLDTAAKQYLAQRHYFGLIGCSAPLFLVLGNHDGEGCRWHDGTAESLAVWSNTMRKRYFPNPYPDGFYSGNEAHEPFTGLLEDYYAWEWGDALFVVLDPFWYTPRQRGGDDNWKRTLGDAQYQWLKRTLERSRAAFKFVFIHHLVGRAGRDARGGVEAAPFYEWGGRNADGADGFREHRPGWTVPIHQLLVQNRVAVVFHGHDHLYVKQDLDGVVYQEVPQPGAPGRNNTRTAAEYGYKSGVILGSSGHLRVRVSPDQVTVEYVLACLSQDERPDRRNAAPGHSYILRQTTPLAR